MTMKLCTQCGHTTEGKHKGSFAITLILLIVFFPAALIYDHTRQKAGKSICTKCNKESLIPLDSPVAKKFLEQTNT